MDKLKIIICPKCKDPKSEDDFGKRSCKKTIWCKACCSAAVRKTYATSPEYRQSCKDGHRRRALKNHRKIFQYLKEHPCACGETDPLVLQFDHNGDKMACVTGLSLHSWERILREIEKCVVRCANCHARKTAKERNSMRYQLIQEEMIPGFIINSKPTPSFYPKHERRSIEKLRIAGQKGAAARWGIIAPIEADCFCGKKFVLTSKQHKRQRLNKPIFCSRACSNKRRATR